MSLFDDFHWQGIHLNDDSEPKVLALHGVGIVRMSQRVDNAAWIATLNYHWPVGRKQPSRACTSLEAGKRGAELWAIRHEARLHEEVATIIAARPKHKGAGGWSRG